MKKAQRDCRNQTIQVSLASRTSRYILDVDAGHTTLPSSEYQNVKAALRSPWFVLSCLSSSSQLRVLHIQFPRIHPTSMRSVRLYIYNIATISYFRRAEGATVNGSPSHLTKKPLLTRRISFDYFTLLLQTRWSTLYMLSS